MINHLFQRNGVSVDMLRLDALHSWAPGNKWFKLQLNMVAAKQAGARTLLSFGGAYSNHLHALAAVTSCQDISAVGLVRADINAVLTPTLQDTVGWGMKLHCLSRSDYRRRHDPIFVCDLMAQYPYSFLIPEGGANLLGAQGCRDIVDLIPECGRNYDTIVLACGTGTTLAGMSVKVAEGVKLLGVAVMKAEAFLARDIELMLTGLGGDRGNWSLEHRFHGGGYARMSTEIMSCLLAFEAEHNILLDPVYTAKMLFAVNEMLGNNEFVAGSRLLLVHTGGVQGRRGFTELIRPSGPAQ
jgi:1-aminocyclopropane-1-carboxylate deaminase